MKLNPYLHFNGNCEKALNFYKTALGGKIVDIRTYATAPMPVPAKYKKKILHAVFKFGDALLMASDSGPGHEVTVGDHMSLSVDIKKRSEIDKIFKKMAAGGKILMPLEDQFWGARFGMLEDKFGVHWMFNFEKKK